MQVICPVSVMESESLVDPHLSVPSLDFSDLAVISLSSSSLVCDITPEKVASSSSPLSHCRSSILLSLR